MKTLLMRTFALAILTNSVLAFAASSPAKNDKTPATDSAAAASAPQSKEDQQNEKKMKKEKKLKEKTNEKRNDDYPGYGIYG
jgi:hypothetical protein